MKNVLILQRGISPMRVPVYNEIAKHCNLTLFGSVDKVPGAEFHYSKEPVRSFKGFTFYKRGLGKILKDYDVIIIPFDITYADAQLMYYKPRRKFKIIGWGIGVSASYTVRFDEPERENKWIPKMIKKSDAALFYTDYPRKKYVREGIPAEKMFVANNTVPIADEPFSEERDSILFVGTLYPEKKVLELVKAYHRVFASREDVMPLNIIGDGTQYAEIEKFVQTHGLEGKVRLFGSIYDNNILKEYYRTAYACFSPDQAGLSVLSAMGYGTPFVTTCNAFTGGERLNITDGENGILMDSMNEIEGVINDICDHPEKYIRMGRAAYDYYRTNRTVKQMADGFLEAIEYVTGQHE